MQAFQFTASRGDKLLPHGGGDFRKVFSSLLEELDISDWGFRPYSLRRGGATEHFRAFNSLSATAVRGRWASPKMARIYLNDGLATLAGFPFEKQHAKLCFFQKLCLQTCTMPRR